MTDKQKPSPRPRDGKISGTLPDVGENRNLPLGREPESGHEEKLKAIREAKAIARRRRLKTPPYKPKHRLGTPRED